ncbi:MAG TPA: VWA domain-containing protein [Candidatus Latescibacteria bacterium]|nr:VWA domain-containing protein [Candidatus Latescibacterota bacterium]
MSVPVHFLRPDLLPLTGLALLPPLIHLLNRRRLKQVSFSHLAFLKALHRDRMRKIRLRRWVLLLLRTITVALLGLAAARPTLRSGGGVGGYARTSAVLLVDVSCSTRLRTERGKVIDLEKDRASEVLGTLGDEDRVWVVPFGNRPHRVYGPSSPEEAGAYIRSLSPTYEGTDFPQALKKAFALLKDAEGANREVYLIADNARHGWASEDTIPEAEGVAFFLLPVYRGHRENAGVVGITALEEILTVGERAEMQAYVSRYGGEGGEGVPVELYLEGRRKVYALAELPGSGEVSVTFSVPLERPGVVSGFVEVEEDRLLEDDRWYFTLKVVDSVDVLICGPSDEVRILRYALAPPGPLATPFRVSEARPEDITWKRLEGMEVVLLADLPGLPFQVIRALRDFVGRGGGLGIFLGERADPRRYNRKVLPVLLRGRLGPLKGSPGGEGGQFSPASWDEGLGDLLSEGSFRVFLFYPFIPGEGVKPLIRLSDGSVVLAESGDGKAFLWSGGLAPEWGDISLRGAFVPLVHRLVRRSAGVRKATTALTGEEVSLELSRASRGGPLTLEGPEGERFTLWPEGLTLRTPPLASPGIWRLSDSRRTVALLPVNVPPRERDLRQVPGEQVAQRFRGARYRTVPPDESVSAVVKMFRYGRELGGLLALLAMCLLLTELVLARASPESIAPRSSSLRSDTFWRP